MVGMPISVLQSTLGSQSFNRQSGIVTGKIVQNFQVSGLCASCRILNARKQRFGNWICFRPQVKGMRYLLCWVP
jgi:hypothetical protein